MARLGGSEQKILPLQPEQPIWRNGVQQQKEADSATLPVCGTTFLLIPCLCNLDQQLDCKCTNQVSKNLVKTVHFAQSDEPMLKHAVHLDLKGIVSCPLPYMHTCDLHGLLVKQRIDFKILTLAFRAIHGQAPEYIEELVVPYAPSRSLRSAHL